MTDSSVIMMPMEMGQNSAMEMKNWWDNESTHWQDRIFFSLCIAYASVSAFALVQLVRIQIRTREYGWSTQKVFHLLNFVVHGVRAVLFGFHHQVFLMHPKNFCWILLDLSSLLFFSAYTVLILFWAQIYHKIYTRSWEDYYNIPLRVLFPQQHVVAINEQSRSLPTDKLRKTYIAVNVAVYLAQVVIWVCIWVTDNSTVNILGKIFMAVVFFIVALGFSFHGGRLYSMLRRFPIESNGRSEKLHEVGSVTAILFTSFLIRCIVGGVSAFDSDVRLDVLDRPVQNLIYYMVVEVIPSALVLFILRKLPPKRGSAQYHPIR